MYILLYEHCDELYYNENDVHISFYRVQRVLPDEYPSYMIIIMNMCYVYMYRWTK